LLFHSIANSMIYTISKVTIPKTLWEKSIVISCIHLHIVQTVLFIHLLREGSCLVKHLDTCPFLCRCCRCASSYSIIRRRRYNDETRRSRTRSFFLLQLLALATK